MEVWVEYSGCLEEKKNILVRYDFNLSKPNLPVLYVQ